MQETTNVRGIYSTSEPIVHFGLGSRTKVDSLDGYLAKSNKDNKKKYKGKYSPSIRDE